jgi:hypothetical protein
MKNKTVFLIPILIGAFLIVMFIIPKITDQNKSVIPTTTTTFQHTFSIHCEKISEDFEHQRTYFKLSWESPNSNIREYLYLEDSGAGWINYGSISNPCVVYTDSTFHYNNVQIRAVCTDGTVINSEIINLKEYL